MTRAIRRALVTGVALASVAPVAFAQDVLHRTPAFEITTTGVRQGRFEARALGRDTLVSNYPRAAREVHFKFALNGRDNEFPPGIEHMINLRPRQGRVETPLYTFAVEPRPQLPRPEDSAEGEDGAANVTVRLDLREVKRALAARGWYKPPLGDTIRRIDRVTVIGDSDPLVWDVSRVTVGAPQDLTDPDGDGIYETTLRFQTSYLRALDSNGRARWVRQADLRAFPTLRSPEPLLDALYSLALEELTQLRRDDGALSAGAKWPGVWTRDVALSTVLGLPFVMPDAVRISLLRKVDAQGRIIQDTGTGGSWPISTDRMTWALAAWELYAVTGDRDWLRQSYDIIARSAEADFVTATDPATGLMRGESSFLDWREQSYPRWMQPADIAVSQALGTNAVHHGAYRVLAMMARELGEPAERQARWTTQADTIRAGMRRWMWEPSSARHAAFRAGRTALTNADRFEALGEALSVLTGVTPREERLRVMESAPTMAYGTPTLWPFIPDVQVYHNASVWPFVTAYWTWAGAEAGHAKTVEQGLAAMTRGSALFLTNKENLAAATGHFEGTALNSDRQLWSVAGSLAMQYRVLFGMRARADRLEFAPMVPPAYNGERELSGLKYRRATLTVRVRGFGDAVKRVTLDGRELPFAELPATLEGAHVLEIEMNSRWPQDRLRMVEAATSLATPLRLRSRLMRGDTVSVEWDAVPNARRYVVTRDGVAADTVTQPRLRVLRRAYATELQVVALDSAGIPSFPSEPLLVARPSAVIEVPVEGGALMLTKQRQTELGFPVRIPVAGRYAVELLYANGNGPINTEDKAAIRTLRVNGRDIGALTMPQRGAGNWSEFGWSTVLEVSLGAGDQEIALVWRASNDNMNGNVNAAIVNGMRLTLLAPPRVAAPRVTKVEPPEWWLGSTVNPVRLLVRGSDLAGAQVSCGSLQCSNIRVNERGSYLFVDVRVPASARAGDYPLRIRTAGGSTQFSFTVHPPLDRSGRGTGFTGVSTDDVIYFVMPDRFADGDTTNNDPRGFPGLYDRRDLRAYHGGDLEGLRQRLGHLKSLGITAIWMTPLYDNVDTVAHRNRLRETGRPYTDYHGYGATDLYGLENRFGDRAALRRLVDDAHGMGIKIILDQVANHTGPEHVWAYDPPTPTWYAGTLARHLPNNWKMESLADPYGARAVQDSTLHGWFADILPDFDQRDPEVERYIIQNTIWWMAISGADAIRQDTWPYVPRRFWKPWMEALKREFPRLTVVGEVWSEDPAFLAFFQGSHTGFDGIRTGLDQMFDFPLQAAMRRVFMQGQPMRQLAQVLAQDRLYSDPNSMVTFLDNHDMPRLPWGSARAEDGMRLAFTFLLTSRGIPQLYYGNEILMTGNGDPDNRREFPGGFPGDARSAFDAATRTPEEQRMFAHAQALLALRRARPELRTAATRTLYVDNAALVYGRGATVVAINNGDAAVTIRVPSLQITKAAVIGGCAVPRPEGDAVVFELAARTACVY